MTYENLSVARERGIATIVLGSGGVVKLTGPLLDDLSACLRRLETDERTRAVVLASGGRGFVAGADIGELHRLDAAGAEAYARRGQAVLDQVERFPRPVIAAVHGYALGGGCELAMACTLRVAAESATFGQPEVRLGIIPGFGGTQRLPRLVGVGPALRMILTGEPIDAATALRLGLVSRVVPDGALRDAALELASALAQGSPSALRLAKAAVQGGLAVPADEGMRLEAALFGRCYAGGDAREGTAAFLQKRAPRFADAPAPEIPASGA